MIDSNSFLAKMSVEAFNIFAKDAYNKIKEYFLNTSAKESIDYGDAYEEYLKNTLDKYSKIKTIIYRYTPKYLYDFYEYINVKLGKNEIDTTSIHNFIDISNKIIISGISGSGKTILLKHLFINIIEDAKLVPVLIELRNFNIYKNKDISIYNTIYNTLINNGFTLPENIFDYSMKKGAYIILFDGYDELTRDKSVVVSNEIISLSSKYGDNKYIITSRPQDQFIGWNDFTEMITLPLTKSQTLSLIKKMEYPDELKKQNFYKEMEDDLYDKYKSFASNPLLLNIIFLTYMDNGFLPSNLNEFYELAFSALFYKHDETKGAFARDIRSKLSGENFKLILAYICFKSYFKADYLFSETKLQKYIEEAKHKFSNIDFDVKDFRDDLLLSICMLLKDGLNYRFTHISFQEYFAAWYTLKLTENEQYRLITAWIKEAKPKPEILYLQMLYDLHPCNTNKVILLPGVKQLKQLYNNLGFSIELLKEIFNGIVINYDYSKMHNHVVPLKMILLIKNFYLFDILKFVCVLNQFVFHDTQSELEKEVLIKLAGKFKIGETIEFDAAMRIIDEDNLLNAFRWFEEQILFSFEIMYKYENPSLSNCNSLSSILDEL